ncbi:hypothetical protein M2432_002119 [Mycobacterium sp. OTB74]|nr:hypothetical protein [Mycobacterium sp. OTB74]
MPPTADKAAMRPHSVTAAFKARSHPTSYQGRQYFSTRMAAGWFYLPFNGFRCGRDDGQRESRASTDRSPGITQYFRGYSRLALPVAGKRVAPSVTAEYPREKFSAQATSVAPRPVDVQSRLRLPGGVHVAPGWVAR